MSVDKRLWIMDGDNDWLTETSGRIFQSSRTCAREVAHRLMFERQWGSLKQTRVVDQCSVSFNFPYRLCLNLIASPGFKLNGAEIVSNGRLRHSSLMHTGLHEMSISMIKIARQSREKMLLTVSLQIDQSKNQSSRALPFDWN